MTDGAGTNAAGEAWALGILAGAMVGLDAWTFFLATSAALFRLIRFNQCSVLAISPSGQQRTEPEMLDR
jgi:hypothetical protein